MDKIDVCKKIAVLLITILVTGCIQTEYSKKCDHITQTDLKDECLEYVGVWYQDPYTCYAIEEPQIRERCITNAVDPTRAKSLQTQKRTETTPTIQKVVEQTKIEQKQKNEAQYAIDDRVQKCMEEEELEMDVCLNKIAIAELDMQMCEKIEQDTYRRPCISNVAISSKDQNICQELTRMDDRQLCKFYASAG